jgi:putative intracellular protease/amidase
MMHDIVMVHQDQGTTSFLSHLKNTQAFANPFHEEGCILTHVCGEFAS